jgi:hypothetical protein
LEHGKKFGLLGLSTLTQYLLDPAKAVKRLLKSLSRSWLKYQHTTFFGIFPKVDSVDLGGCKMANADCLEHQSQEWLQVERQPPTSPRFSIAGFACRRSLIKTMA